MMPAKLPPPMYDFQARALVRLEDKLRAGCRAPVVVSPTGSGKTVMAAHAMQSPRFPVVRCISHRVSLNEQNAALLCPTWTPQALKDGLPDGFGKPDLVIWEECHHSEAPTFQLVRKRFPNAILLGLTATPQRSDGLALSLFDDMVVAAHYSELLFNKTIVPCQVDVPSSFYEDQTADLALAYLDTREQGSRGLIFCRSMEEADDVAKRLKRVQAYHSGRPDKENKAALTAFRNGTLEALTTVDALSEGMDVPEIDLIVLGQRCENVSTYLQRCGRGLRVSPGKRRLRVIDCLGASLRHGSPIEDRVYSISGTGIQRRGTGQSWDYERVPGERKELKPYRAKFRTLYGWTDATAEDKRRQLGWIRRLAAQRGYTEDVARECFETLFGEGSAEPSRSAEPHRRSSPPSSRVVSSNANGQKIGGGA